MSDRPRLLDLFCGAGGAARGDQLAGFHVTGVDSKPQPRYAGDDFVQADALAYVAAHGREFDVIHASPPCQQYTALRRLTKREYPDLIAPTRRALEATGRPWVIENVPVALAARAMGIAWMTRAELSQAIPPAYCEWLGRQLLRATGRRTAETGGGR